MGVKSDFKVVVSDNGILTPAVLMEALTTLHERDVPDWATVEVNSGPLGWAVVAKWDPDDEPTTTTNISEGRAAVETPEERATRLDTMARTRTLRDNPQA